jgi:hypothetical protein
MLAPKRWYLEPTQAEQRATQVATDGVADDGAHGWCRLDPCGDCLFTMDRGVEIHAPPGRDLRNVNLTAPRVTRAATGDLAVEADIVVGGSDTPCIGGLLVWKDEQNYLRLDLGVRGRCQISMSGCVQNRDILIGRGLLASEQVTLRLERNGDSLTGLCSAGEGQWLAVGEAELPLRDPIDVGVFAVGSIDRMIYHGGWPEGCRIRFRSIRLSR